MLPNQRYTATRLSTMDSAGTRISLVTAVEAPWIDVSPIRLGAVPSGLGPPDLFALIEAPGRTRIRLDLYRAINSELYVRDEVILWRDWIAVGFGYRVFLITPLDSRVREIPIPSYFAGFHAGEDYLLIIAGEGLVRVDLDGRVVWTNGDLAIDGVELDAIEDGVICGNGEWDPPGGWRPFRIRLATGEPIDRAV